MVYTNAIAHAQKTTSTTSTTQATATTTWRRRTDAIETTSKQHSMATNGNHAEDPEICSTEHPHHEPASSTSEIEEGYHQQNLQMNFF